MKNLFKLFIFTLLIINFKPVFAQTETLLDNEGFENGFPTYWGPGTPSCSYSWTMTSSFYHNGSYSIYFPSKNASSGCYHSLFAPLWLFKNVQPNDSIKIAFSLYRGSTYSSSYDRLDVKVMDSNGVYKLTPQSVYRYYGLPPAMPSPGWVECSWKFKCSDINPGNRVKFAFVFTAVSDYGDNIYIDDVKTYRISSQPPKSLTIIKPNGGEIINLGSNYNITWTNNNVSLMKIEFTIDGGITWNSIATNIAANLQTYSWTVPSSLTVASQTCKVRITDMSDQTVKDESDAYFELKSQKSVSLIKPNGAENIPSQHNYDITWTSTNVSDLKIEFSIDGGINWNSIVTTVNASTQKYTWMVPTVVSSSCKVRLTDNSDQSIKDESDSYFSIYNGVSIKENLSFSEVNIYPSPASDQINLTYDLLRTCDVSLKLFDISGKIINDFGTQAQSSGRHLKHIETLDLQDGIYYFEMIIDNNIQRKKIVINK